MITAIIEEMPLRINSAATIFRDNGADWCCSNGHLPGRLTQSMGCLAARSRFESPHCETTARGEGKGLLEFGACLVLSTATQQEFSQEFVGRLLDRRRAERDREL